jgi:hypothetical protein
MERDPIVRPPVAPLFFYGSAPTPDKNGNPRLVSDGQFALGGYAWDHPHLSKTTQFIQLKDDAPIVLIRGVGFEATEGSIIWRAKGAAIALEGRAEPPTGRVYLRRQVFDGCEFGVHALPGYYDDRQKLVESHTHADMVTMELCEGFDVAALVNIENRMGLCYTLTNCALNKLTNPRRSFMVRTVAGYVSIRDSILNHDDCGLFDVRWWSPHNPQLIADGFRLDRVANQKFCIIEQSVEKRPEVVRYWRYSLRARGYLQEGIDPAVLVNVPPSMPQQDFDMHVKGPWK